MLDFINEIDTKNRDIILSLVKNHFSLKDSSFKFFEGKMLEPDVDPTYARNIGNDLRFKMEIQESELHHVDRGWKIFKKFKSFINKYGITYSDFRKNKVLHKKNILKIFKLMSSHYTEEENFIHWFSDSHDIEYEDSEGMSRAFKWEREYSTEYKLKEIEEGLKYAINDIGKYRLPDNEKIYFVLSLNFADWLLCSTAESWRSCLNLESGCEGMYWAGLPGLIGDKNRAMIYLTNGEKKEYLGIVVDKMLCRSWVLLDNKDKVNAVRFYPNKIMKVSEMKRITGIDMKLLEKDDNFSSKYPVHLLRFTNGCSAFIFQDYTQFDNNYLIRGSGGMHYYDGNYSEEGSIFGSCRGLRAIVQNNKAVLDYPYDNNYCSDCGDEICEDDVHHTPNGEQMCPDCFYDHYFYCDRCNDVYSTDESCYTGYSTYCQHCFDRDYYVCDDCGEAVPKDDALSNSTGIYCEGCYEPDDDEEK